MTAHLTDPQRRALLRLAAGERLPLERHANGTWQSLYRRGLVLAAGAQWVITAAGRGALAAKAPPPSGPLTVAQTARAVTSNEGLGRWWRRTRQTPRRRDA